MHSLQGMRNSPYYPINLSEQLYYVLQKSSEFKEHTYIHTYVVKRRGGMVGMGLASWLMPLSMVCFSRTIQKLHDTFVVYPLSIELHKHDGDDI